MGLMLNCVLNIHYKRELNSFEGIVGAGYTISGETVAQAKLSTIIMNNGPVLDGTFRVRMLSHV